LPAVTAHANRRADLAAGVKARRRTRRGGRVVDRTALEMRSTRKCTGGSNPSLSANPFFNAGFADVRQRADYALMSGSCALA
jgi:hypothetical protein